MDDDAPLGPLAPPCDRLPALEEGAQLGDQREGASLVVLRNRQGLAEGKSYR